MLEVIKSSIANAQPSVCPRREASRLLVKEYAVEFKLAVPMARQPKKIGIFFRKRSRTLVILPGGCNSTGNCGENAGFLRFFQ